MISDKIISKNNFIIDKAETSSKLKIGDGCKIDNLVVSLSGNSECIIENHCIISGHIKVGYNSKLYIKQRTTVAANLDITVYESSQVEIGEDCMFSTNCIIRASDGHMIFKENEGGGSSKRKLFKIN